MPTEQELREQLATAEKEYQHSKMLLAKAKKYYTTAETEVINCKIEMDRIKEALRVHHNTVPSVHPEIELRDLEIEKFRQDNPEIMSFIKEREQNKP